MTARKLRDEESVKYSKTALWLKEHLKSQIKISKFEKNSAPTGEIPVYSN